MLHSNLIPNNLIANMYGRLDRVHNTLCRHVWTHVTFSDVALGVGSSAVYLAVVGEHRQHHFQMLIWWRGLYVAYIDITYAHITRVNVWWIFVLKNTSKKKKKRETFRYQKSAATQIYE